MWPVCPISFICWRQLTTDCGCMDMGVSTARTPGEGRGQGQWRSKAKAQGGKGIGHGHSCGSRAQVAAGGTWLFDGRVWGLLWSESWVGGAQKAHGIRKKGTDLQPLGAPAGGLQHALSQLERHTRPLILRHSTGFWAGKSRFLGFMHAHVCVCVHTRTHTGGAEDRALIRTHH